MSDQNRKQLLEKAEQIFLTGMAQGYASGAPADPDPHMPCWKGYAFRNGDWWLLDRYTAIPRTCRSAGFTEIYYKSVPIWFMSYGGVYKKEAIPCLKQALLQAYQQKVFHGGRGISFKYGDHDEEYQYINITYETGFEKFRGEELVWGKSEKKFGEHNYWGMALI